jgi:hypothetical protein
MDDGLVEGRLLENAFEDPLFNVWGYLSVRDLVAASQASREMKEKSIFGFMANEIFSGFGLPLVFDNAQDYDLEQLILQLKRYHQPTKVQVKAPEPPAALVQPQTLVNQEESHDSDEEAGNFLTQGRLGSASFDEYDDFTPRHPVPKDKVHRRGDSYFNSDITEVARLAHDPTVSAAVRKFANITLKTEIEEEPLDVKAEASPHIPSFGQNRGTGSQEASVFTFE